MAGTVDRGVPQREIFGDGDVPLTKARPIGVMGGEARTKWYPASASIATMRSPATATQNMSSLFEEHGAAGESISNQTICGVLSEDAYTLDVKVSLVKAPNNHINMRFVCNVSLFLKIGRLE